jgi:hypothetical protein
MPRKNPLHSRPWLHRYRAPAAADLVADLDPASADHFRHLRSALTIQGDVRETLAWHGIPWRWSFRYTPAAADVPIAYLIPQPDRPSLILPLPEDFLADSPDLKLSRHNREAITLTPAVGGIRWTHWHLTSRTLADELLILVRNCATRGTLQLS